MDAADGLRYIGSVENTWFIAVDVGGTFCDAVAIGPDGRRARAKIPSASRARGDDGLPAPIAAAYRLTQTPLGCPLPPIQLRVGTTRGTNALLEGRVSSVCMVLPEGLEDILEIGDQRRPDLFAWHPTRTRPPVAAVCGVRARIAADGTTIEPLTLDERRQIAASVSAAHTDAVAVALLHADVDPTHEDAIATDIRQSTSRSVSTSHAMGRVTGFVDRARAAHADALLSGPIRSFVAEIAGWLSPGSSLLLMTSAGGLSPPEDYHPKDSLLSGPAGGVRGAVAVARRLGLGPVLAFDMGGTSTDISRVDQVVPMSFSTTVAGVTIASPSTAIDSIAAGGGSIVRCVGGEIRIGPESAGSDPGPACYGRGGPLTITDLQLLANRLGTMPIPISLEAAQAALDRVLAAFQEVRGPMERREFVNACLALADEMMASAIRRATVRLGHVPQDHTLLAFGGAGPLHACAIADRLGISDIIIPADAGLLSARGIASAQVEHIAQRSIRRELQNIPPDDLDRMVQSVDEAACAPLRAGDVTRRLFSLRLLGQESALVVESLRELPSDLSSWLVEQFRCEYQRTYASEAPARAIELASICVVASERSGLSDLAEWDLLTATNDVPLHGPQVLNRMDCTIFVADGWQAAGLSDGSLRLTRRLPSEIPSVDEPLREEIMASRIRTIAEDMGEQLRRTAVSVNVKERLDFSCSVLDADGYLVANAPHLPVHLGAMGECVRQATRDQTLAAGDALVVNHPAYGGSHLPDVTVISPVVDPQTNRRVAWVANRAHHAELGGTRPGSMPPDATTLEEEGVVIVPLVIMRDGQADLTAFRDQLCRGPYPSRQPQENELDLLAQIACNELGRQRLLSLLQEITGAGLAEGFRILTAAARRRAQYAIESLPGDELAATEWLDDGSPLVVRLIRSGSLGQRSLRVDFSGSAAMHAHNFNAPQAVVRSAVMYVLRLIAGRERPEEAVGMVLNEGFLADVEIVGLGGMLGPSPASISDWPAVAAGNTETSQRVTDLLLKACRVSACSQGTMNNLLFGNDQFGFYETIAGGAGASAAGAGLSAVHTHMTNTKATDPEILERRLPVRLERFSLRPGSGGAGIHQGGDGVIRRLRFLEPVSVTLIAQHRQQRPYGMDGGVDGAAGEQFVVHVDGRVTTISGVATAELAAGDAIEIHTPGGGGWKTSPSNV